MAAVDTSVDTDASASTPSGVAQSFVTDSLVWVCTSPPLLPHSSVPVRSCGR